MYNCTPHLLKDQPEDVQLYTPHTQKSAWRCTIVHSTYSKSAWRYTIVHLTYSKMSLKMALQF